MTMNYYGEPHRQHRISQFSPTQTQRHASRDEVDAIFQLCRTDDWHGVLAHVHQNPWIALTPMVMDNHISTTIIHQAITSKGDTALRAEVIATILSVTPQAAAIKNGYGSLPLHVIAQRNTKIDAPTKERLIFDLVHSYKGALTEEGGVGKRTPLHIIFTDYISPHLTRMMIENGAQACFMKDKKGYLPAHVACSRHCSPEKLRMLLSINPGSLYDTTAQGQTLLDLATQTATKSHPNYALIDELNRHLSNCGVGVHSNDDEHLSVALPPVARENHDYKEFRPVLPDPPHQQHHPAMPDLGVVVAAVNARATAAGRVSSEEDDLSWNNRSRLDSNDSSARSWNTHESFMGRQQREETPKPAKQRASRKRKANPDPAADLLLHFSRNSKGGSSSRRDRRNLDFLEHHHQSLPTRIAEV